jgi:uncharacterized protein (TIGR02300 family)
VAKPEWGLKRQCHSCGLRFYDLQRDPIVCPHCGAAFDALALLRPRRARAEAVAAAPAAARAEPAAAEVEDGEAAPEPIEDEEELIEDASELGEDEEVPGVEEGEAEEEP